MYYPEEVVDQVVEANDIVEVIGSYVSLKKTGSNYMGLCPFHSEKTPSFCVSPGRQMYHCFGCGESGNVITFLMKYENCTFQEALKILSDRAGIALPEADMSSGAKRKREQRQRLLAINKAAAIYYYKLLRSRKGIRGQEYLKKRKLTEKTINQFGLGYADGSSSDLVRYLQSEGYADEDILASGVAAFDEKRGLHDKFWNRVMFPIMDINSRVIGFGGRVIGEGQPKYLNSPETPVFDKSHNLYGMNVAKKTRYGYLILCEGYMDVIAMHQAGFTQAVASLGTAFTEGQASILRRYVKKILLAYDSDGAGVHATLRNSDILRQAGLDGRVVHLEPYKDPDEFIKGLGAEEFQKRLDTAENSFYFQIHELAKHYTMTDPASRSEFYHELARRLSTFDDEIERDSYCKAMAKEYYIDEGMLEREVEQYREVYGNEEEKRKPIPTFSSTHSELLKRQNGEGKKEEVKQTSEEKARKNNEGLLLTWISEDPGLYSQIRDVISKDDFEEGISRTTAEKYFAMLEQESGDKLAVASGNEGRKFTTPSFAIASFEDEKEQEEAAKLFEVRLPELKKEEQDKAFRDILKNVKRAHIAELSKHLSSSNALNDLVRLKKELGTIKTIPLSFHNEE